MLRLTAPRSGHDLDQGSGGTAVPHAVAVRRLVGPRQYVCVATLAVLVDVPYDPTSADLASRRAQARLALLQAADWADLHHAGNWTDVIHPLTEESVGYDGSRCRSYDHVLFPPGHPHWHRHPCQLCDWSGTL